MINASFKTVCPSSQSSFFAVVLLAVWNKVHQIPLGFIIWKIFSNTQSNCLMLCKSKFQWPMSLKKEMSVSLINFSKVKKKQYEVSRNIVSGWFQNHYLILNGVNIIFSIIYFIIHFIKKISEIWTKSSSDFMPN